MGDMSGSTTTGWGFFMTHSMPGPVMGCEFFFSGFSNTQTRPLSWHLRQGDYGEGEGTGPDGMGRATSGERDG